MPRFFFDIHNTEVHAVGQEAVDLSSLDMARWAAIRGIRSILADEVRGGRLDLRGRIHVRDECGRIVLVVQYAEAILIRQADESV